MTLAHIGLGIFVISITAAEGFTAERDVALGQGQTVLALSPPDRIKTIL